MKIIDLLRLAAKTLKGKWMVLPAAGVAICVFCLCFAGAVLTKVEQEKSLPYELSVSSGTASLSDSVIVKITDIDDVTAATPVLQVPVSIETGEYSAQLTLTGISDDYLDDAFAQGSIFVDSSIMPYIVLNKAACKQFATEENGGGSTEDEPKIDWLNSEVSIQLGEGMRPIVSKISGILADDDDDEEQEQEVSAYISISSAKQLLQQNGQDTDYMGANVRITNIGCADSVSKQITALGLSVANTNEELQSKWDMEMKEMTYLIVIGAFCVLCSIVLMAAWRKISLLEQKGAYASLLWIGMKAKHIGRLFAVHSVMISLIGIAVGILVSTSLPSFLSQQLQGTSIFTLQIPFGAAAVSAGICIIAGIIPLLKVRYSAGI